MSRSTADSAPSATLPTPKERRRLREALALSEEQVAEAMGVTKATVRSWETGRSTPRGRKREAYARLLTAHDPEPPPTHPEPRPEAEEEARRATASAEARPEAAEAQVQPPAAAAARPSVGSGAPAATSPAAAGVRPKAAVKRAAKPPRAPSPAPAIAPGPARKGAAKPPERLKPVEAPMEAEPAAPGLTPEAPAEPAVPGLTPEEAFDALYAYIAPGLVHQTYLLTGRRGLSREAVEHAFHHAWQRWPEVAVDADPAGWVRAAAYEYALSPWHR
uniref:helix-turn-helix domain-containing protein n=1 Tax=Streptomyces sp. NRRL B-24572 TaxID=1962156 RepID=UPI0011801B72